MAESGQLSLEAAIEAALQNNPRISIAQEKIKERVGTIKVVRSPYLPDIRFSAQYLRLRDPSILNSTSFDDIGDDLPFDLTPEAQNLYNLTFTLEQPLYTFGKARSAVRGAKLSVNQAEFDVKTEKQDLSLEVALAYFNIILSVRNLEVLEATASFQKELVKVSSDRFEAGLTQKLDVLRAESALANLKPTILSAKNRIRLNKVQLNQLLGRDGDAPLEVAKKFPEVEEFKLNADKTIAEAFLRRPELSSLLTQSEIYREAIKIAKAGRYPSLNFSGSYGQSAAQVDNLTDYDFNAWSIMFNFEVPIFDGMRSKGEVEQYTATLIQTLDLIELQKDLIALESRQTLFDLEEALYSLEATEVAFDAAKRSLETARDAFSAGTASSLDVLDSQRELSLSAFNIIQAEFQLAAAITALKRVIGLPITEPFPESFTSKEQQS
jgi:multidrug efflux system outer membrane protein